MKQSFNAPWSKSLLLLSAMGTGLCVGIPAVRWASVERLEYDSVALWATLLPLLVPLVALVFTVRRYVVTPDVIRIKRFGWTTVLPITELLAVEDVPQAMKGSLRVFGNGGFFSFTGRYWSSGLGAYRAYVTDPDRTVVLHYPAKTIVISPESPLAFIHALRQLPLPLGEGKEMRDER